MRLLALLLFLLSFARPIAAQTLRFYYFADDRPLSWQDADGHAQGNLIEALDLVAAKAGLTFVYVTVPWSRAQIMMQQGDIDAFLTIASDERRRYALFADTPMIRTRQLIFHRSADTGFEHIETPSDLALRAQIRLIGGGAGASIGGKPAIEVRSLDAIVRMLASGHGDYFVSDRILMTPVLERTGLAGKISTTPAAFLPMLDFRIGLRKTLPNSDIVVTRLDAAIREIRDSGAIDSLLRGSAYDQ